MSRGRFASILRQPWISRVAYTSAVTLQLFCTVHLINEYVFQVRNSTGSSMLPVLATQGDILFQLRLPVVRLLESVRNKLTTSAEDGTETPDHPYYSRAKRGRIGGPLFERADQAQGTGLRVGDLVVAQSPADPNKTVCKRVIGLPGDTVCLDPRMRPLPMAAWRGRGRVQPPAEHGKGGAGDDGLESKLVKFEDLLSDIASGPKGSRSALGTGEEVDLLKSMDTNPSPSPQAEADTDRYNNVASSVLQHSTYIRSKGDVQYVTVPLGHVWLAGDNLGNSTDSRHYGPVPLGMVHGKVLARVFPNPTWLSNNLTFVD